MCMRVEERDILIHNSSFLILNLENAREIDIKKNSMGRRSNAAKGGGLGKRVLLGVFKLR